MNRWECLRSIAVLLVCAGLAGCGRSPYELAAVRGSVTVDGRPMPYGRVMFAPRGSDANALPGKPAIGVIQPDGSFALSTYGDNDGAVVGMHTVTVFGTPPAVAEGADAVAPAPISPPSGAPRFKKITVPNGPFEVAAGQENRFDIALTRQDIQRLAVGSR